jgi:hypothetical protein
MEGPAAGEALLQSQLLFVSHSVMYDAVPLQAEQSTMQVAA